MIIPNAATDTASSIPETAIMSVGMPLATPYPFILSLKRHETTTAGDTAATTEPKIKNRLINSMLYVPS